MKLLFDENLASRLVVMLAELFPDSAHVRSVGLRGASDTQIWDYARSHGFAIVSKDWDFQQLSFLLGAPPKVVRVRRGNCTVGETERIRRVNSGGILEFGKDREAALLVLS